MKPTSPTTVFFVRHGETLWHEENRYAGSSDIGLTERGVRQSEALGRWSATAELNAIVTSDLSRAVRTAVPAVAATGLQPRVEPALREVDFGEGEGKTRAEMAELFPEQLERWLEAPASRSLPGGESGVTAITRSLNALSGIVREHPGGRVLIVAHSTLARLLICELFGIDPNRYRTVFPAIDNCAINEFRLSAGSEGSSAPMEASLVRLNVPVRK